MKKTILFNLGGPFGDAGEDPPADPPVEFGIKHPFHAFKNRVTYLGGDVYTAQYGGTPLTKAQILADQFAVEGDWDNPPPEVIRALNAKEVTLAVSYQGMSATQLLIRGYNRYLTDGVLDDEPTIDDLATRFYRPDPVDYDDYVASSPDISIWAAHHSDPSAWITGGVLATKLSNTTLGQSQGSTGTPVEEYLVDTGVPLGGDPPETYSLRFEGYTGATSDFVDVEFRVKALFIAKHRVWILPFSIRAETRVFSFLGAIQDALYDTMMAGEYAGDIAEIEEDEIDTFYTDNPDVITRAAMAGAGLLASGVIYSNTPAVAVTYDDPTPTVTISGYVGMPTFLPEEMV